MQKNNGIFVISVSTYLKNSALLAFLFSFYRFYKDNGRLEAIHIADDGNNHAKKCIERFERKFPFIRVTGQNINGSYQLDELYINILHQGANNFQLSFPILLINL